MKKIEAIVRPNKVEDVKNALSEVGVRGMSTTEIKGFGRQKGHKEVYRGAEYTIDFVPKIKIEIVVPDDRLQDAVRAICDSAVTGKLGDGKIFISDIQDAIRIRTGESGDASLE